MTFSHTDTTRYLCTAAYLDKAFRDIVIKRILKEEYRAIAASHGVDLLTVVKHCLVAEKREINLEILLTILLLIFVVTPLFAPFLYFISFICFLIAYTIIVREEWFTRYIIIAKSLAKGNFNPDSLVLDTNQRTKKRLEEIAIEQDSNVIVYGGFSPFVGSGIDLGGWSFALNLKKVKKDLGQNTKPIYFETEELYEYIANSIKQLKLHGLTIEDKLCINGQEIRGNKLILPELFSRPSSKIETEYVNKFVNSAAKHIRYYKHIKIVSWQGDLIFSVFFRFLKVNEKLFVEASHFLLTPVYNYYRLADAIEPEITVNKVSELLLRSLALTMFMFLMSPFSIIGRILEKWQEKKYRKQLRRIVKETPNFNYGAIISIRELASTSEYSQHFQMLDKEMYQKIVERQIVDSLVEFLESKNIDTSDLQERQTGIFNSGMIISGGAIHTTNLAVGENAKSLVNHAVSIAKVGV